MALTAQPEVPGIEIAPVTEWLRQAIPDLTPPVRFTRVGNGRSNLTFLIEDGPGYRAILRRPPLGPLLASAHDMRREYRVLSLVADEPVPTPSPVAMCEDPSVTGAPFYVMECVDGVVLRDTEVAERMTLEARARAGRSLAETLAAIHGVDITGAQDLGRPSGYAERQIRRWSRQWEQSRTRDIPSIARVARVLEVAVPPQTETTLVHGDYSFANVLVSDTGELVAVLDWELCTIGDPVADLGMLMCYWPDSQEQALPERDSVPLMDGFPSRKELVQAYSSICPERALDSLGFWTALCYWKLAIILEGVYRRGLESPANQSDGADLVRASVDRMAELAEAEVLSWI